jgi:hypothetical protein
MSRATITAFVFSVLLFGFLYIMFTNKTLVFKTFEVQMEQEDFFSGEKKILPVKSNLACVLEGTCILTFNGWVKLMIFFIGLPIAMFVFIRWRIRKKIARALEKQNPSVSES